MDKKALIVSHMQQELDCAHQGNVEPLAGESYMSIEYIYHMLKSSFEKTFIPEHILDIFVEQDFPLCKFYDYFVDHDCFRTEVNWEQLCREYAIYIERDFIEGQLYDKIQAEYKKFMICMSEIAPYRMEKLLSEISFKMQVFSMFRYQDCFSIQDKKVLQGTEGILDKAFKKYSGDYLTTKDEHFLWATVMECLGKVVEENRGDAVPMVNEWEELTEDAI